MYTYKKTCTLDNRPYSCVHVDTFRWMAGFQDIHFSDNSAQGIKRKLLM